MLKYSLPLIFLIGLVHSIPKIDPGLLSTLQRQGKVNLTLTLTHASGQELLRAIETKNYTSRAERLNHVAQTLKNASTRNQDILHFLTMEKENFCTSCVIHSFWITNKIIVREADLQFMEKLRGRSDIREIREEKIVHIDSIDFSAAMNNKGMTSGVTTIRAPEVWALGWVGEGAIVANIDTGVRGTHEALVGNHRSNYGWRDPEGQTDTPNDQNGQGTHTMGTMVGQTNEIGVAPGAHWIACKGCSTSGCTEFALLMCAEWIACPTNPDGTNPDCSMAPNVVSNSWGGGQGNDWFDDPIAAWRAGGILPIFTAGWSGPSCGSVGSPGDSALAIAVGSIGAGDMVSSFSGAGPTTGDHRIKPDVVAPGSNIFSATSTSDTSYRTASGAGSAPPHAAGLVALLFSKNPDLTLDQVTDALFKGAVPTQPTGANCGGIDENLYPNNHVGYGRIDALNSIALV